MLGWILSSCLRKGGLSQFCITKRFVAELSEAEEQGASATSCRKRRAGDDTRLFASDFP